MKTTLICLLLFAVNTVFCSSFEITSFSAKPIGSSDGNYQSELIVKHNSKSKVELQFKVLGTKGKIAENILTQVGNAYNYIQVIATNQDKARDTAYLAYNDSRITKDFISLYSDKDTWDKFLHLDSWNTTADKLYNNKTYEFLQADKSLPNVLLVGNSISIGYTPHVRRNLAGKANVYRIPENGGDTYNGVTRMELWLGDIDWSVIHVCFGLHDLKYTFFGNDRRNVSPEEYEINLRKILDYLTKKTKAKIVWALTTYYPVDCRPRRDVPDAVVYNDVVLKVLKDYKDVQIDDHYSVIKVNPQLQRKANVHFANPGYSVLAEQTAKAIEENL